MRDRLELCPPGVSVCWLVSGYGVCFDKCLMPRFCRGDWIHLEQLHGRPVELFVNAQVLSSIAGIIRDAVERVRSANAINKSGFTPRTTGIKWALNNCGPYPLG